MPGGPGPYKTLERQESGTRHAPQARLAASRRGSSCGYVGRAGLGLRARIKLQIPGRVARSESDSGLFSSCNHRT